MRQDTCHTFFLSIFRAVKSYNLGNLRIVSVWMSCRFSILSTVSDCLAFRDSLCNLVLLLFPKSIVISNIVRKCRSLGLCYQDFMTNAFVYWSGFHCPNLCSFVCVLASVCVRVLRKLKSGENKIYERILLSQIPLNKSSYQTYEDIF